MLPAVSDSIVDIWSDGYTWCEDSDGSHYGKYCVIAGGCY